MSASTDPGLPRMMLEVDTVEGPGMGSDSDDAAVIAAPDDAEVDAIFDAVAAGEEVVTV